MYTQIIFIFSMLIKDFWYFALRGSGLGLISSMLLDGGKGIHSVKSARLTLRLQLKARVLPPLEGNNREPKMNTHTHIYFESLDNILQLWYEGSEPHRQSSFL